MWSCQFDESGTASIAVPFADKSFLITYNNTNDKDYGAYRIGSARCGKTELTGTKEAFITLPGTMLAALPEGTHTITADLV